MISLTPTARLEWMLHKSELGDAHSSLRKLIEGYEAFLSNTDAPEEELIVRFMDKRQRTEYLDSAYRFGDLVFEVLARRWKEESLPPAVWCLRRFTETPSQTCQKPRLTVTSNLAIHSPSADHRSGGYLAMLMPVVHHRTTEMAEDKRDHDNQNRLERWIHHARLIERRSVSSENRRLSPSRARFCPQAIDSRGSNRVFSPT